MEFPGSAITLDRRTGGGKGALEGDGVLLHAVDGIVGDDSLAVLEDGGNVNLLPNDRDLGKSVSDKCIPCSGLGPAHLGRGVDLLDRLSDLGTDTCEH